MRKAEDKEYVKRIRPLQTSGKGGSKPGCPLVKRYTNIDSKIKIAEPRRARLSECRARQK